MPSDYQRIAAAIKFLRERATQQPTLEEAAAYLGLSTWHFQRLFKRYAGVSPKRFLQFLTISYAKELLRQSHSLLETSLTVGLSGTSRLHDLMISVDAMTPGEYQAQGAGLDIDYGFHPTPFGNCLIALTHRGICRLEFYDHDTTADIAQPLRDFWPQAQLEQNQSSTAEVIEDIFFTTPQARNKPLTLLLKGTNFQLNVWQALLRIPPGEIVSYGELAKLIDHPMAVRAVGTAVGNNPVSYLIPCHRVLRGDGTIGGYRWGIERKQAMLAREFARQEADTPR